MISKYNIIILLILIYYFPANLVAQPARQYQRDEAGGEKITNEIIYRELKIFEAKTEERFKAIEQRLDLMDKSLNRRIDEINNSLNQRIDNLYTFLWILSGIFTAMVLSFAGLLFWDRKTIIDTAAKKTFDKMESEGSTKKIIDALRELAKEDQKVAAILKNFNLL